MSRAPREGSRSEHWKIWAPAIALTVVGFFIAAQYVKPGPPHKIVIATGSEAGGYHRFGRLLAEELAAYDIELEVRTTAGSVENAALLRDGEVDLAFVQGGVLAGEDTESLEGVASLYYEPLWIFTRHDLRPERLGELAELRLEVGAEGSGTRALVRSLLEANGITASERWSGSGTPEAVERLLAGEVDAIFLVASPSSSAVQRLAIDERDRVRLMSLRRHHAYARRWPALSSVLLSEGMLDLDQNLPDHDHHLVAATAGLLAHDDLHPALVPLLIEASDQLFGSGGLFEPAGAFPGQYNMDVPLAPAAERYFESGPSFLFRVLPFWAAAMIDRLIILALPLLTLLIPLGKLAPPLIRWRTRFKIYKWYRDVLEVERGALADVALDELTARLDKVEREIQDVVVPLSYAQELYHLRLHLEFVRRSLSGDPEPTPVG